MTTGTKSDTLLLTVPEAAEELRAGASTVWKHVQKGDLPSVRVGRSVRIRRSDLEAFVERHYVAVEDGNA